MKPKIIRSEQQKLPEKMYQKPKTIKPEHQEFLTKVGVQLQELKKYKGISSMELCKQTGISRYTYHLILRGQVYWNSQTLLNLLTYFNIDEIEFFSSLKKTPISK